MRLRHRVEGPPQAPVAVLVHAIGTTLELWEPQLPALGMRLRVVRYDQRGHGGSDVPPGPYTVEELAGDLLGLLDELEIERAALCGLSLGGAVAMAAAVAAPERVERLALCCTTARFDGPEQWRERARLARSEGMDAVVEIAFPRWFSRGYMRRSPQTAARFRRMLAETPAEGYAACCEAIAEWDFGDRLAGIAAPTLVVSAEADVSTPPPHGERLAAAIPDARLEIVAGAGHLANVERPDVLDGLVLEHLCAPAGSELR
jgi:3-oxoadipate enol-lactonase